MKTPSFLALVPEILLNEIESGRAAIVGGAIRCEIEGTKAKDIDIFVFDEQNHKRIANILDAQPSKRESQGHVFIISGEIPIEIVCLPGWDSAGSCAKNADFDIASGIYCSKKYILPVGYEESIKAKKMRFSGHSDDPQASYDRFLKYNTYGFQIDESINELLQLWRQ